MRDSIDTTTMDDINRFTWLVQENSGSDGWKTVGASLTAGDGERLLDAFCLSKPGKEFRLVEQRVVRRQMGFADGDLIGQDAAGATIAHQAPPVTFETKAENCPAVQIAQPTIDLPLPVHHSDFEFTAARINEERAAHLRRPIVLSDPTRPRYTPAGIPNGGTVAAARLTLPVKVDGEPAKPDKILDILLHGTPDDGTPVKVPTVEEVQALADEMKRNDAAAPAQESWRDRDPML